MPLSSQTLQTTLDMIDKNIVYKPQHDTSHPKQLTWVHCDTLWQQYQQSGLGKEGISHLQAKALEKLNMPYEKAIEEYEKNRQLFRERVVDLLENYEKDFKLFLFVLNGEDFNDTTTEEEINAKDRYYDTCKEKGLIAADTTSDKSENPTKLTNQQSAYIDLQEQLKKIDEKSVREVYSDLKKRLLSLATYKKAILALCQNPDPLAQYLFGKNHTPLRQWADFCVMEGTDCQALHTQTIQLLSQSTPRSLQALLSELIQLLGLEVGPKVVRITGQQGMGAQARRSTYQSQGAVFFGIYAIKGGKAEQIGQDEQSYPDTNALPEGLNKQYGTQQWLTNIDTILQAMTGEPLTSAERERAATRTKLDLIHAEEVWLHFHWKTLQRVLQNDVDTKAIERFEVLDSLTPCGNNDKNCETRVFGRLAKMIKAEAKRDIPVVLFTFRDDENLKYGLTGANHRQLVYDLMPDTGARKFIGEWRDPGQRVEPEVKSAWLLSGLKIFSKKA